MTRNYGLIERARYERVRTIDPRHEEPPHGDWPHFDPVPTDEMDDANRDFLAIVLTGIGIAAAFAVLVFLAVGIWLASMVFSWPV